MKFPGRSSGGDLGVKSGDGIVQSAALCLCTSGGEGCGKRWPDRCKRRKEKCAGLTHKE